MQDLFSAILADPKTWAGIAGGAFIWLWRKVAKVIRDAEECRIDRAKLREEVTTLRGAVDTLTSLLKREINIG